MSGFKEQFYGMGQYGGQVTPDEIDQFTFHHVINPSITGNWIGTVSSATANAALVIINQHTDYSRNLLYSVTGVAAGMGGTFTAAGKDQFGQLVTETVAIGSANGGGTAAGTQIFRTITAGTFSPAGAGGTAVGTASFGVAIGTAAGLVWKLGLPVKIAGTSDVRQVNYTAQGVQTTLNGGTIGAYVNVADSSFSSPIILAGTSTYTFRIKSTYDNSGKPNASL